MLIVALILSLIVALIVVCDPQTAHDGSRRVADRRLARRSRDWLA